MSIFNKPTYRMPDLRRIPWLHDLVNEIHTNTGIDKRMILMMILGVLSCVLQKLYTAKCPNNEPMPIALMIWILASSGSGKTLLFKLLTGTMKRNQKRNLAKYLEKFDRYLAQLKIWTLDGKINEKAYKKAKEADECTKAIEKKILEHQTQKPKPPRKPVMMNNDSSIYAMIQNVMDNHVSLFLASSDAISMLDKNKFEELFPILVELYSGMDYTRRRKNEGDADLSHTLITVLLMVQENILMGVWEKIGDKGKELGLWARNMFCIVPDDDAEKHARPECPDWTHLRAFEEKLQHFLDLTDKYLDDLNIPPEEVAYSPEAAQFNGEYIGWIHEQKKECGAFANMKDIAARMAEISGKIAVILHAGSMKKGALEYDTLQTAIDIYMSFLPDLVKTVDCEATEIRNAKKFYHWLYTRRISRGKRYISWSKCLRSALPKYLQEADVLHPALDVLTSQGTVTTFKCGRAICIELDPTKPFDWVRAETELHTEDGIQGKIEPPLPWRKPSAYSPFSLNISSKSTLDDLPAMCIPMIHYEELPKPIDQANEVDDLFGKYLR